jgi:hypothetical protein
VSTSIHAQHALSAAEDFFAVLECKVEATHGLVREIAVLFFDEGFAVAEEGHAYWRLVDHGRDAVDHDCEGTVGLRDRR